jgi:cyclopropane-fatty-acyl-phospholipid synthase
MSTPGAPTAPRDTAAAPAVLHDSERGATNQHYDQDPAIFSLFLDASKKYSSGLFLAEGDDLDRAQTQKMAFVADQLGLRGGERVLDVGCGWGALVCFLAEHRGCRVTGLTPSPKQAEFIRARARGLAERVNIEVTHFQETAFPARSFDAITLLGSIVHMQDKASVLAECFRLCKQRGRVYLSESCFRNAAIEREFAERPGTVFVRDSIFGWGELLPLSRYVQWFEDAGFSLTALTDLTSHYYQTIEHWRANALANRDRLDAIEAGLTDKLVHYFDISNAGWGYTSKHYALVGARSR